MPCTHTHYAHTALAITPKIHVFALCHTHMPKPQANNTLRTNKLPATTPHPINTHRQTHKQWELLLPPAMPPGVQSKCQPREKGLSAGAASEEASPIFPGPVEARLHARTHSQTQKSPFSMFSFSNKHPNVHTHCQLDQVAG